MTTPTTLASLTPELFAQLVDANIFPFTTCPRCHTFGPCNVLVHPTRDEFSAIACSTCKSSVPASSVTFDEVEFDENNEGLYADRPVRRYDA